MLSQTRLYLVASPFALILAITCLICAIVNKRKGKFTSLVLFLILNIAIILCTDFELLSGEETAIMFWSHLTYSCIAFLPVTWALFCLEYSTTVSNRTMLGVGLALSVIPVATTVFAWTNQLHHLLWRNAEFVSDGILTINHVSAYGPWFWAHSAYCYALFFAGIAFTFRGIITEESNRRYQSARIAFGVCLPVAVNLLYVFRLIPGITRDFSSLVFTASGLLFLISIVKYRLFDMSVVEYRNIVNTMEQALIILDGNGAVRDMNEPARALLSLRADENVPIEGILELAFDELKETVLRDGFAQSPIETERGETLFAHIYATELNSSGERGYALYLREPLETRPFSLITRRERDVYELLVRNLTTKEIAESLCISENTAKTHIRHIYEKMQVTNRRELMLKESASQ